MTYKGTREGAGKRKRGAAGGSPYFSVYMPKGETKQRGMPQWRVLRPSIGGRREKIVRKLRAKTRENPVNTGIFDTSKTCAKKCLHSSKTRVKIQVSHRKGERR